MPEPLGVDPSKNSNNDDDEKNKNASEMDKSDTSEKGAAGSVASTYLVWHAQERDFPIEQPVLIGRQPHVNDIVIPDDELVSEQHATIYSGKLIDRKSTHDTFIDGEEVKKGVEYELTPGQVIWIGDTVFHVSSAPMYDHGISNSGGVYLEPQGEEELKVAAPDRTAQAPTAPHAAEDGSERLPRPEHENSALDATLSRVHPLNMLNSVLLAEDFASDEDTEEAKRRAGTPSLPLLMVSAVGVTLAPTANFDNVCKYLQLAVQRCMSQDPNDADAAELQQHLSACQATNGLHKIMMAIENVYATELKENEDKTVNDFFSRAFRVTLELVESTKKAHEQKEKEANTEGSADKQQDQPDESEASGWSRFGSGVWSGVKGLADPFIYPHKTVAGLYGTFAHPMVTGRLISQAFERDPAFFWGNLLPNVVLLVGGGLATGSRASALAADLNATRAGAAAVGASETVIANANAWRAAGGAIARSSATVAKYNRILALQSAANTTFAVVTATGSATLVNTLAGSHHDVHKQAVVQENHVHVLRVALGSFLTRAVTEVLNSACQPVYFRSFSSEELEPDFGGKRLVPRPVNLVFQGGGPKGLVFVSALKALEAAGVVDIAHVQRVGGASAGAITALLLAVGYTTDELMALLEATDMKTLLDEHGDTRKIVLEEVKRLTSGHVTNLVDANRCIQNMSEKSQRFKNAFDKSQDLADQGIFTGDAMCEWLAERVAEKLVTYGDYFDTKDDAKMATFADLKALRMSGHPVKELSVVVTDISTKPPSRVDVSALGKTRDVMIVDAVRCSMSIPMFFTPSKLRSRKHGEPPRPFGSDHLYQDGGMTANYPLDLFDRTVYLRDTARFEMEGDVPTLNSETLGFRIIDDEVTYRYYLAGRIPDAEPPTARVDLEKEFGGLVTRFIGADILQFGSALINHARGSQLVNCLSFGGQQESKHTHEPASHWRTVYLFPGPVTTFSFDMGDAEKHVLKTHGEYGARCFVFRKSRVLEMPVDYELLQEPSGPDDPRWLDKPQFKTLGKLPENAEEGFCSWCVRYTVHELVQQNSFIARDIYRCTFCDGIGRLCCSCRGGKNPQAFANEHSFWPEKYCDVCSRAREHWPPLH